PRICFVNKMDRTGANFQRCVDMIIERLGGKPVILYMSYGEGDRFGGLIDVMKRELIKYCNDLGTDITRHPLPEDFRETVEKGRTKDVEMIVETDEALMEKYLMEEPVNDEELQAGLRAATIAGKVNPTLSGSSLKNKGVQLLLDAVVDYL